MSATQSVSPLILRIKLLGLLEPLGPPKSVSHFMKVQIEAGEGNVLVQDHIASVDLSLVSLFSDFQCF